MTSPRPFVSVVVPTRNRPNYLRHCLESLSAQTFDDFEVIVSDNHTGESARHVFSQYARPNFSYIQPERPLAMCDNWEFACARARGQYVTVLIDKTVLLPSALERLHQLCQRKPYEVVSWRNESYDDIPGSPLYKTYFPDKHGCEEPRDFDPRAELRRRLSFDVRRGTEGYHYFWGKICFGAYHESLISRIRATQGRLFFPICPDYTSMVLALALARSAIDMGVPLLVSAQTEVSNGMACSRDERAMRAFLDTSDPERTVMEELPIRDLYASVHNLVARDYVMMLAKGGASEESVHLCRANLLLRCLEDLNLVQFTDAAQRRQQYAIWLSNFSALPAGEKARVVRGYARYLVTGVALSKAKTVVRNQFPEAAFRASRLLQPSAGGAKLGRVRKFESINAAALAAEEHYWRQGPTSLADLAAT